MTRDVVRFTRTRTCAAQLEMSALGHKRTTLLFDHRVGDREQSGWQRDAERFCGLEIEDQFEFVRLNYWQVRGLLAFEDAAGVDAGSVVRLSGTSSVTHEAVGRDDLTSFVHC